MIQYYQLGAVLKTVDGWPFESIIGYREALPLDSSQQDEGGGL